MQRSPFIWLIACVCSCIFSPCGPALGEEKEPSFEEVNKNPMAFRGKKVTWDGVFSSLGTKRVIYLGKVLANDEKFKFFAIEFKTQEEASKAAQDATIVGIVSGEATFELVDFEKQSTVPVKGPLIKLISFMPKKNKPDEE